MRILIEPRNRSSTHSSLGGHECQTVRYAGMAGLKNGDLLESAEAARFDVFLTVDQGIEYQQNLSGRKIAMMILRAKSNRLRDLLPLVPACLKVLESVQPGQIVRVGVSGSIQSEI